MAAIVPRLWRGTPATACQGGLASTPGGCFRASARAAGCFRKPAPKTRAKTERVWPAALARLAKRSFLRGSALRPPPALPAQPAVLGNPRRNRRAETVYPFWPAAPAALAQTDLRESAGRGGEATGHSRGCRTAQTPRGTDGTVEMIRDSVWYDDRRQCVAHSGGPQSHPSAPRNPALSP